ncbi:uncharacterized protein LOC122320490 [Drosophila ficusphila]|uniref:uncharacterized protein LOC122320490 n=1 Tax=Drosophila ficusphila TaxID=30025 RepID=UPI001C8A6E86|nr:uncharacterized protein LOC122320490 [Drosophila ficusphila]XP_043064538.1 uncharacterized protein LOC122320490 [Drosophila ficusphila]
MSEPPNKIRRIDFSESDHPSVSHSCEERIILCEERILSALKEQNIYLAEQNAALHRKIDVLAEKLAENTAVVKLKIKAEEKTVDTGVPFPLKTEDDIELFESSMTPERREFYKAKITNFAKKDNFAKVLRKRGSKTLQTSLLF